MKYCKNLKNAYDLGTEILYEICFVYNSTQKASPEELQLRIKGRMQTFGRMSQSALNLVFYIDLQSENNMLLTKQNVYRILVPMSYISV